MRDDVVSILEERYPEVAGELCPPFLELLSALRAGVHGDLDKVLVILAVGARTVQHSDVKLLAADQLRAGRLPPVLPSLGTNIRSIADSIGAPRETIRRKVHELIEAGWLVRDGRRIACTAKAARELAPLGRAFLDMVARQYEVTSIALARAREEAVRFG